MITERLKQLYATHYNDEGVSIQAMPKHASSRDLYRMTADKHRCIGVHYEDVAENRAFLSFAKSFFSCGLNVPEILVVSPCETLYLISDLGDSTLFDELLADKKRSNGVVSSRIKELYKASLSALVRFQTVGAHTIDYSLCYQGQVYGEEAMQEDFAAFKSEYLKRKNIDYDQQVFDRDVNRLIEFLLKSEPKYFMYRDFQARNIVIDGDTVGFVDFQSGRKGPLQYDVVSLLFQSQAELSSETREEFLDFYLAELRKIEDVEEGAFRELFYAYVLMRLFQVLATYGREGLGNGKAYFLNGIPKALAALNDVVKAKGFPVKVPELHRVTELIVS